MKIDKELLLQKLNMVKPGLSVRESIQQSSCFVFYEGQIITFNDEIACRISCEELKDMVGALPAALLLSALDGLKQNSIELTETETGQLRFEIEREGFRLNRDAEVLLPVEKIKEETPELDSDAWHWLPSTFQEAVEKVKTCVSTNEEYFALTCIHFTPKYIEACDSRQMLRWRIKLGLEDSLLVRGAAVAQIQGLAMTHMCVTESWMHFKNEHGLIMSCRKFTEDYPNLGEVMAVEGTSLKFPKSTVDAAEKAEMFASEQISGINPMISVYLRPKWMTVQGEGLMGDYWKHEKLRDYHGPKIKFIIAPSLLRHIVEKYNEAQISSSKLKASGERWDYVSVLIPPKSREDKEKETAAAEAARDVETESPEPTKKKKKKIAEDEEVSA